MTWNVEFLEEAEKVVSAVGYGMSRKNHKRVNGRLLQMDKQFSDLKERQKSRIAEWLYMAYREACLRTGREPDKKADREILNSVMAKIEDAEIWIPYGEIVSYYRRRKKHMKKRLDKEKIREDTIE